MATGDSSWLSINVLIAAKSAASSSLFFSYALYRRLLSALCALCRRLHFALYCSVSKVASESESESEADKIIGGQVKIHVL